MTRCKFVFLELMFFLMYRFNAFLCCYQNGMDILVAAAQELEPWLLQGAL